jgi:hypothetical protein
MLFLPNPLFSDLLSYHNLLQLQIGLFRPFFALIWSCLNVVLNYIMHCLCNSHVYIVPLQEIITVHVKL